MGCRFEPYLWSQNASESTGSGRYQLERRSNSSNSSNRRWTRIGPGLFRYRSGTVYQVKRKGAKVVWKKLEGVNGHTEMSVSVEPVSKGPIEYLAQPWGEPKPPSRPVAGPPPSSPQVPMPPSTSSAALESRPRTSALCPTLNEIIAEMTLAPRRGPAGRCSCSPGRRRGRCKSRSSGCCVVVNGRRPR